MAIITISRGSMSGGEALAKCLAERLQYPSVGREIVVEAAERAGVPEATLARKFEHSPTLWGRLTSDRRIYVTAVQAALAEHAAGGDLIYHGLAGHLLLKGIPNVLRVRLVAPLEARIRAVVEQKNLSREDAIQYIEKVDENRVRWTRLLYDVDWRDPSIYDMVINLESMSIETACSVVANAAQQPEYATTETARKILQDFLLSCRVKLALAGDPQTRGLNLEARGDDGRVEISGEIPSAEMLTHASRRTEDEILRVAQGVQGVTRVILDLRKFDMYH
jgi:cytidylate kinase